MKPTRDAVAALMNANDRSEIIFTRNSTEALNLMAHSYGRGVMKRGQAVLISGMEHHSNIVPWQLLRDAHGIELRVAPVTDAGELDMAAYEALLEDGKVGLVAMTHMSNVLGTIVPAERIVRSPMRMAPRCCSTAPRPSCIARSMFGRWAATSTPGPATNCMAPPASACCGAGANCWSGCRRSWAAAT